MTLCAKSESALKMPSDLIWLASKKLALDRQGRQARLSSFRKTVDGCQFGLGPFNFICKNDTHWSIERCQL